MKFLYFLLFSCLCLNAQEQYPKDYFRSPLDVPMDLSGNFGELRTNHFHSGFDFRTQQREGLNVYAVADGYVSRIKISTYGYGRAIYITHPNGYTTVYGHLQNPSAKIDAIVKKEQYKTQSFEVEMFFKPNEIPIKKGEIIALSGNTGGSGGPHLHFEIRDNKTENSINPYFFGFDKLMKDTRKPKISSLYVYPIDENSIVNQSKRSLPINLSLQKDGSYLAEKVIAKGKIGFGVQAVDLFDNTYFTFGLYKAQAFLNGNMTFNIQFDSCDFGEQGYLNAYIDYYKFKTTKVKVQKLFMKTPFPLSIIQTNKANGIVDVTTNFSSNYRIELSDYYGNKTLISVPIEFSNGESIIKEELPRSKYATKTNKDANFEKDNWSVFFPSGTFYDDFYLDFDVKDNTMTVQNDLTPVNNTFLVSVVDNSPTNDSKTFIASVKNGKLSYNNTKRKDNTFSTYTKKLGGFILSRDTTAPKVRITKSIEGKWITSQKLVELIISDDMSGLNTYNGYINGKWVLFEHEYKDNKITHYFDESLLIEGENVLKVVVTDNVGNSTIFETRFFRSQKK